MDDGLAPDANGNAKGGLTITNYEKIKAMSIEEMADFLESIQSCSRCRRNGNDCFLSWNVEQWLDSETDDNT